MARLCRLLLLAAAVAAARAACPSPAALVLVNGAWKGAGCVAGAAAGATCTGVCNARYNSTPTPMLTCTAANTWQSNGAKCNLVCGTNPPAALLGSTGSWGACTSVPIGGRCNGTCASGFSGSPSVLCTSGGWTTLVGRCVVGPACPGLPKQPLNAQPWPVACAGKPAGTSCVATCNPGYSGAGLPTSTCGADSAWSTPSPPDCLRGSVADGTAFMAANDKLAVCSVRGGNITACQFDPAFIDAEGTPTLSPAGMASFGSSVVMVVFTAEFTNFVLVCGYRGLATVDCVTSNLDGVTPSTLSAVAIDTVNAIAYFPTLGGDGIVQCMKPATMSGCKKISPPELGGGVLGAAVAPGWLYYSDYAIGTITRCPIGAAGLPPVLSTACQVVMMPDVNPGLISPTGLLVVGNSLVVGTYFDASFQPSTSLFVCDLALTTCSAWTSTAFATPGYGGLALRGTLYVPTLGIPGISLCASGVNGTCVSSPLPGLSDIAGTGSVVVMP